MIVGLVIGKSERFRDILLSPEAFQSLVRLYALVAMLQLHAETCMCKG
jgi:hypothetical protein